MILSVKLHCLYVNLTRASKKVLFYNNKNEILVLRGLGGGGL